MSFLYILISWTGRWFKFKIMYFVYILKSLKNQRYYIGSTSNLKRRIQEHNSGKSKYTKLTIPFKLVYKEQYQTLSKARKREYYLKKLKSRKNIEKLIKQMGD